MQIVIDKKVLVDVLKICLYSLTGADYKDTEEAVNEILDRVGYVELPEKHGRLIDADALEWYGCTSEAECPYKNRKCKDCDRAECSKRQFDSIPTIIEATEEQA